MGNNNDSIYEEPSEDYPIEDAEEIVGAPFLLEEHDFDVAPPLREEPLDARIARNTYAYATRQEKYDLYRRFRNSVEPECLHKPGRKRVRRY